LVRGRAVIKLFYINLTKGRTEEKREEGVSNNIWAIKLERGEGRKSSSPFSFLQKEENWGRRKEEKRSTKSNFCRGVEWDKKKKRSRGARNTLLPILSRGQRGWPAPVRRGGRGVLGSQRDE